MNTELKNMHMKSIEDPAAVSMYDMLCDACEGRDGGMTDTDQMLIADAARLEQTKQILIEDIKVRGIGQERKNGSQRYYQENKSIASLRSVMEQQRKLLSELRLTPNSRKADVVAVNDEFSEF